VTLTFDLYTSNLLH